MDEKSSKNIFQMVQKLFKIAFGSTVIIFDHSDHVKAKVDRGETVQVVRMIIWEYLFFIPPPNQGGSANQPFGPFTISYGLDIVS